MGLAWYEFISKACSLQSIQTECISRSRDYIVYMIVMFFDCCASVEHDTRNDAVGMRVGAAGAGGGSFKEVRGEEVLDRLEDLFPG